MWPRIEVFTVLAIALLMASAEAQAGPELTSVSGDPGVFHLLDSATVDGGENGDDEARGISVAFDGSDNIYLIGYMTRAGEGHDIWLGKFDSELVLLDSITITGPDTDHDDGYGIVFDGNDTIFVTGTMIETDESYNIWMAELDTDLTIQDQYTINGPTDGEDVAYMMELGPSGRLYHTGTYTETAGGTNIWIARYDPSMDLEAWVTLDGPASGYDTGVGVAVGHANDLYVSAIISDPVSGLDMWLGHFDVSRMFADGFENGDTSAWSGSSP